MKKSAIFLIENYIAGGSDKIARILIEELNFSKVTLFINRSNDNSIVLDNLNQKNILIKFYNLITFYELVRFSKNIKNKFIKYLFLTLISIFKYPLFIFSVAYFFLKFRKIKFNLFIANNGGYPGGDSARSATIAASLIPNVRTFHIIHSMPRKPLFFFKFFEIIIDKIIGSRCEIISVSNAIVLNLKRIRHFNSSINVIHNGIKNISLKRVQHKINEFNILNLGYFDKNKNQSLLIRALGELKKLGYKNINVTFVGSDEGELEHCKQLSRSLEVQDFVTFKPFENNVCKYFEKADLLVLCSYVEGLPISILEALRASIPVIATNVGGISEQIIHGKNGFLINTNDHIDLANNISLFIDNKKLLAEFGGYGRRLFEKKFSSSVMINEYSKLLNL